MSKYHDEFIDDFINSQFSIGVFFKTATMGHHALRGPLNAFGIV